MNDEVKQIVFQTIYNNCALPELRCRELAEAVCSALDTVESSVGQ